MSLFSQRLRSLRTQRGLSQQRLAQALGVSKSSINMYERGDREPGLELLQAMADYFGVDMDDLLGRASAQPSLPESDDILDHLDVAFLGDYSELTEENKATLRDMARIMLRNQSKKKE